MIIRFCKVWIGVMLAGLLTACGTILVDGERRDLTVRYGRADIPVESGALFAVGDDYRHAFNGARRALSLAGFDIISADLRLGLIEIGSNSVSMVHCGTIATGPLDNPNIFPANTPTAILEVPAEGGGSTFVRRSVTVRSTATVEIAVDPAQANAAFARVSENHTVRLALTNLTNGDEIYDQTIQFSGSQPGKFQRGVICGSAQYVREILSEI